MPTRRRTSPKRHDVSVTNARRRRPGVRTRVKAAPLGKVTKGRRPVRGINPPRV